MCCHGLGARQSAAGSDVSTEDGIVEIRYQATTSEELKRLARAVVN